MSTHFQRSSLIHSDLPEQRDADQGDHHGVRQPGQVRGERAGVGAAPRHPRRLRRLRHAGILLPALHVPHRTPPRLPQELHRHGIPGMHLERLEN